MWLFPSINDLLSDGTLCTSERTPSPGVRRQVLSGCAGVPVGGYRLHRAHPTGVRECRRREWVPLWNHGFSGKHATAKMIHVPVSAPPAVREPDAGPQPAPHRPTPGQPSSASHQADVWVRGCVRTPVYQCECVCACAREGNQKGNRKGCRMGSATGDPGSTLPACRSSFQPAVSNTPHHPAREHGAHFTEEDTEAKKPKSPEQAGYKAGAPGSNSDTQELQGKKRRGRCTPDQGRGRDGPEPLAGAASSPAGSIPHAAPRPPRLLCYPQSGPRY